MQSDWLTNLGPREACLSALEISQAALQSNPLSMQQTTHLGHCPRCRESLAEEVSLVEAARLERLPPSLQAQPARWHARWSFLFGTCTAALLLVFISPSVRKPQVAPIFKGSMEVYATVRRDGQVIADDEALGKLHALRAKDRLQLRVSAAGPAAIVESYEDGQWQELYRGLLAPDGWVPGSLLITQGVTRLRLTACQHLEVPESCSNHEFDL